jgi:hypothetical protein
MNQTPPKGPYNPIAESQQERWMKYGGNVVLMTVAVIAIAVLLVYLAERRTKRLDTTSAGLYSLKAQTVNIIKDNPQKVQITSLYTRTKPAGKAAAEASGEVAEANVADQAEKVDDLLEEYKSKGKNISVDSIDPDANPAKVDDLIQDVTRRYGGQVDKYKTFSESYPKALKKIAVDVAAEADKIKPLMDSMGADLKKMRAEFEQGAATKTPSAEAISAFNESAGFFNRFGQIERFCRAAPAQVQEAENVVARALKTKPPAYKDIADNAKDTLTDLSANLGSIAEGFKKTKDDAKIPEAVRKYMDSSLPRYEAMKKSADDLAKEAQGLGELKLDTLREALRQRNSILIRGEKEWKIIPYEQVWRKENRSGVSEAAKTKPRFAGEQMITTAILALQQPKKLKVAFVRPGGAPLTDPGMLPFREGGPFAAVAERLREYNYDVMEKDLTGMWAVQQMQQQQGMSAPEPSDADIKDAVWIVIDVPGQPSQFGPAPTIAPKVVEHLANGGSALILAMPRADDLSAALKEWGITLRTDAMLVHELIKSEGAQADMIEQAKKNPIFFEIRDWGSHPITAATRSLPGIFFFGVPVVTSSAKGVKVTPLIPIPDAPSAPKSWGDTEAGASRDAAPKFKPDKDLAGPLFGGAAAEKDGGGRVVVIGSARMMFSDAVELLDPELERKEIRVIRFPGNGELFSNSIYWLSKQETMIAISPASMDVGRIEDLTPGAQRFWRGGVLLFGLPMLVLIAGVMVYLARRD